MAVAIAWLPGPAGTRRRVAKPSVEEPDAAEPARPDLWGARVSNDPGLPDLAALILSGSRNSPNACPRHDYLKPASSSRSVSSQNASSTALTQQETPEGFPFWDCHGQTQTHSIDGIESWVLNLRARSEIDGLARLTERRSSTTGRRHPKPAAVPGCNHDYRELNSKLHGHDGRAWLFHRRCSSSCCRSCLRQPGTPCRPAASLSEHRAGSERTRSQVSFCLSRRSPSLR